MSPKRLGDYAKTLSRACHQELRDIIAKIMQVSQKKIFLAFFIMRKKTPIKKQKKILTPSLPVEQRIAPRPVKPGTLDLSATRVFFDTEDLQLDLLSLVQPIFLFIVFFLIPPPFLKKY